MDLTSRRVAAWCTTVVTTLGYFYAKERGFIMDVNTGVN